MAKQFVGLRVKKQQVELGEAEIRGQREFGPRIRPSAFHPTWKTARPAARQPFLPRWAAGTLLLMRWCCLNYIISTFLGYNMACNYDRGFPIILLRADINGDINFT